ncbi:MAG: S41 family peptidase [Myxococcaceae bacterium]
MTQKLKRAQVARGQLLVPVNLPSAVLVDSETASSAEILAAALKSIKDWAERLKAEPTLKTAIASVSP